jgi:DNA segregation ATPase FtsK/SpoIIIE, S-DNA-T family
MSDSRNVRWDMAALFVGAIAVFVWLSLLSHDAADPLPTLQILSRIYQPDEIAYPINTTVANICGYTGAWVSHLLFQATGAGAYIVAALLVLTVVVLLRQEPWSSPLGRSFGWSLVGLSIVTFFPAVGLNPGLPVPIGSGGYLGAMTSGFLHKHTAFAGGLVLIIATLTAGLLLSTKYAVLRYLGITATGLYEIARALGVPAAWLVQKTAEVASTRPAVGRSDLPASLTLRKDTATGAVESVAHQETLPPIRIGRKAQGDTPAEIDLSSETAESLLGVASPTVATAATKSASNASSKGNANSANARRSMTSSFASGLKDSLLGKKPNTADEEVQAEESDEYESEEYENEGEEDVEETIESAIRELEVDGETTYVRADEAHDVEGPRIANRKQKKADKDAARDSLEGLDDTKLPEGSEEYVLPGIDLLIPGDEVSYDDQEAEVRRKAKVLEQTFKDFNLNIRVVEIETGPVIAQYEIELEAGLRLNKITGLSDDLAIALRVPSVRIVAPIPGKNTVGIEVPNEKRQVVRLREVIEESGAAVKKMKIPLFLGKDVSGKALTVDLATLPHLLIAGRTGTGKSVCLNSIITSILMSRRPDEVRMLMIDPKMVELSGYARLPHLMHPVVTDMKKAEAILAWAVDKMEERYALLARAGVRHITNYNQLGHEELHERLKPETADDADLIPDHLPFIVIVADEIADMMMTCGKEVESHIIRLAQKSRAVGIHLILATQKPTVDVITGLIKSNLPARISFQVASRTDSRVVLDEMGADKLLGNGDMLFLWPQTSSLLRGQGTYLGDDEINRVVDHCSTGEQNFVHELMHIKPKQDADDGDPVKPGAFKKRDELYESAVDIVVREGRGSCSLLQRAMGIGYGRAARLIDFMAEDGIVGQYNGSQAREVVLSVADWEAMRGGEAEQDKPARKNKIRRDDGWDTDQAKPTKHDQDNRQRAAVTMAADEEEAEEDEDVEWEDVEEEGSEEYEEE